MAQLAGPSGGPQLRCSPSWSSPLPPGDLCSRRFVEELLRLEKCRRTSVAAVVGFVEEDGDLYNAAAVCARARCARQSQAVAPRIGVFDERRYFAPGEPDRLSIQESGGVTICETPGAPRARWSAGAGRRACRDAERVAVPRRHPSPSGSDARHARCGRILRLPMSTLGGQDELSSTAPPCLRPRRRSCRVGLRNSARPSPLRPRGRRDVPQAALRPGPRGIVTPLVPSRRLRSRRVVRPEQRLCPSRPLHPSRSCAPIVPWLNYEALVLGTSDYVRKNGHRCARACLACDSSLVATIAADALGADRVHGVSMPSASRLQAR